MQTRADVTIQYEGTVEELVPLVQQAVMLGCDVVWTDNRVDNAAVRVHPNVADWDELRVILQHLVEGVTA